MVEGNRLSRTFLDLHPEEAARVLEALPPSDVASFLRELAPEKAAASLARMLPGQAAACIEALGPETARDLAAHLEGPPAAGIIRCLTGEIREALVSGLRPGRRRAATRLLAYPTDTLGAWADPRVVTLRRDATVAWAKKAARLASSSPGCEVFVVEGDGRLAGRVAVANLLRSDPDTVLGRILDPDTDAWSARTGLARAAGAFQESEREGLPVVDARGRLVGVLSRRQLEHALGRLRGEARAGAGSVGALGLLAGTFGAALAGLVNAWWAILAPNTGGRGGDRR